MPVHLITAHQGVEHIASLDDGALLASVFGTGEFAFDFGSNLRCDVGSVPNTELYVYDGEVLMQGRHIRVTEREDLMFSQGDQGKKRNDLIVLRYERALSTGVELATMRVIEGVPGTVAVDPDYIHGDIIAGAAVNEMPLYRVPFDGTTRGAPVKLFKTCPFKIRNNSSGQPVVYMDELRAEVAEIGSLGLDKPLDISEGGTGADTAQKARENLGITPANIGVDNYVKKVGKTGIWYWRYYSDGWVDMWCTHGGNRAMRTPRGALFHMANNVQVNLPFTLDTADMMIFGSATAVSGTQWPRFNKPSNDYISYDLLSHAAETLDVSVDIYIHGQVLFGAPA